MKAFISLPYSVNGMRKSVAEIEHEMQRLAKYLAEKFGKHIIILDSYITDEQPPDLSGDNIGIWYIGKSLEVLAHADIAVFANGWNSARGCIIEHEVAKRYGIPVLEVYMP